VEFAVLNRMIAISLTEKILEQICEEQGTGLSKLRGCLVWYLFGQYKFYNVQNLVSTILITSLLKRFSD
jgi:hypothetical protein